MTDSGSSDFYTMTLSHRELQHHSGSEEVIPARFCGVSLNTMGMTSRHKNPFFKLKSIAMDRTQTPEDRMQAVRYMIKIPHVRMVSNAIEAAKDILGDYSIPVQQRYFFFSNNEKYFKLEGNIVKECHVHYFNNVASFSDPLILKLLSAQFIYCTFGHKEQDWISSREFIIALAKDKQETVHIRSEAADILCRNIDREDMAIGREVIKELGNLYSDNKRTTIYTNAQNAHDETITESVMSAIRVLAAEKKDKERKQKVSEEKIISFTAAAAGEKAVDTSSDVFEKILSLTKTFDTERKDKIISSFKYLIIYPAKYEGLTLSDILLLIWNKIQDQAPDTKKELENRVLEELFDMNQTCGTGQITRLINILSGYVHGEGLEVKMSVKEQLRSNVFARLGRNLRMMSAKDQDKILEEIGTDGLSKGTAKEFLESYSVYDELREEFVDSGLIDKAEFDKVYKKCTSDFIGEDQND